MPARRSLPTAFAAELAGILDRAAWQAVAGKVKYPVAALMIAQTVLTIGVTAMLSRQLGQAAFGQYVAIASTIAGLFFLVAGFPVEMGLPKFLAQSRQVAPGELRGWYTAALSLRLLAALVAVGLGVALAGPLAVRYDLPGMAGAIVLAVVAVCLLQPLAAFYKACIQGMERPRRWATANLLDAAIGLPAAALAVVAWRHWGQTGLLAVFAVGWLVCVVVCLGLARGALGFWLPGGATREQLKRLFLFTLPLWLVPIFGFGSRTVIKLALLGRWGPAPVGQIEIALTLLAHLGMVYNACMIVYIPEWSRLYAARQGKELLLSLRQARGVLLGVAWAYGLALAAGGQWLVPALFGADQAGAVPAARVMGVVMPIMITGWVASTTYIVSSRTAVIGKANLIWFSIVLPSSLLLQWRLGSLGAALGFLAAYCVFAWYYVSRARPFFAEVADWETG